MRAEVETLKGMASPHSPPQGRVGIIRHPEEIMTGIIPQDPLIFPYDHMVYTRRNIWISEGGISMTISMMEVTEETHWKL